MEKTTKSTFNQNKTIIRRGIEAGALMVLYLFVIQMITPENATALRFGKYLILGAILYFAITKARAFFPPTEYFKEGMVLGAGITVLSAVVIGILNTIAYAMGADISLDILSAESESFGQTLAINGILLFEIFIGGMIMTFIILQATKKGPERADTKSEQ